MAGIARVATSCARQADLGGSTPRQPAERGIHRALSLGLALSGGAWRRPGDTVRLAGVVNAISRDRRLYLAAGGLGVLIGDGRLSHAGHEDILETYYGLALVSALHLTADYQWVRNPAYNRDRGPVSIFALRVHLDF